MNKKLLTTIIGVAALYSLSACGGSSSDDSGVLSVAGVWQGSTTLIEDTCGAVDPNIPYLSFNHLINQDIDKILLDNGASVFSGKLVDDMFEADISRATTLVKNHGSCTEVVTWRYDSIRKEAVDFVVRKSDITCQDKFACSFTFNGSGYRVNTDPNNGPIPVDIGIGGGLLEGDLE